MIKIALLLPFAILDTLQTHHTQPLASKKAACKPYFLGLQAAFMCLKHFVANGSPQYCSHLCPLAGLINLLKRGLNRRIETHNPVRLSV